MDIAQLVSDLQRDEGVRLKPYVDTVGKMTIGVGRNLTDRGITEEEAGILLVDDIDIVTAELDRNIPWWKSLPEPCQRGLANMVFNMGWPRLSAFKNMLGALEAGSYREAAQEALDSRWARQVGDRAERIASLFRNA